MDTILILAHVIKCNKSETLFVDLKLEMHWSDNAMCFLQLLFFMYVQTSLSSWLWANEQFPI